MSKIFKESKPAASKVLKSKINISRIIRSARYDKVTMGYKGVQGTVNKHTLIQQISSLAVCWVRIFKLLIVCLTTVEVIVLLFSAFIAA